MAGASLLMLLDDITSLLDDISLMTKVAARKTASVLGDDLALNAEQVSGVRADRELPVVWAVAKGSFINKAILVPSALAISAVIPWAIIPLLMLGGTYLCFEGAEKIAHSLSHKKSHQATPPHVLLAPENSAHVLASTAVQPSVINTDTAHATALPNGSAEAAPDLAANLQELERSKIKGAIRTDFVLSAEIIVITLGIVADAPFMQQVTVLAGIAVVMTIGVYGLVAGIVKLDDLGLYLSKKPGIWHSIGLWILAACPYLMRGLTIVGTAAMFLVGGSILVHGLPWANHWVEAVAELTLSIPAVGGVLAWLTPHLLHAIIGIIAGMLVVGLFKVKDVFKREA